MKRFKKFKKQDRIKADRLLQAWLAALGAREAGEVFGPSKENGWPIRCPAYLLNTPMGPLRVHPASSLSAAGFYSVTTRFAEPERARAVLEPNSGGFWRNGKWNFLASPGEGVLTPENWVEYIQRQLSRTGLEVKHGL